MKQLQQAVIFDLVGVLFAIDKIKPLKKLGIFNIISFYLRYRTNPLDYGISLLDKMRKEAPGEYQDFLTLQGVYLPNSISLWQRGLISTSETFAKVLEFFTRLDQASFFKNRKDKDLLFNLFKIMFDSHLGAEFLVPQQSIIETLERLRAQQYKLFVLSNIDTETYQALVSFYPSIFNIFDGIVTSCDTQTIKPHPDIFLHLLKKYNLTPESCYFIDDQSENIITAKGLGMNTILCTHPSNLIWQLHTFKLL